MIRILDKRDRDELEETIETNKKDLEENINENVNSLNSRINSVNNSLTTLISKTKTDLQNNIDNLEGKHDADNTALTQRIDDLTNKHNTEKQELDSTIAQLEVKHDEHKAELDQTIIDVQDALEEALETTATALQDNINNNVNTLNETITNTKKELSDSITAEETRAKNAEDNLQTQINTIINNPDAEGVINSMNEFTQYITDHGKIADGFRNDINANANAIDDEEGARIAADNNLDKKIDKAIADINEVDGNQTKRIEDLEAKFTGASSVENQIADAKDEAIATAAEDATTKASTAEANAISVSNSYTDELADGQVATNTKSIASLTNSKVDKVDGKDLSDNNFTNDLKTSYDAAYTHSTSSHAPSDAEKNVQSDFNETDEYSAAYILNKPGIASVDNIGLVKVGSGLSIDSETGELSAQVDLSNYYTKEEVDALIEGILAQIKPVE